MLAYECVCVWINKKKKKRVDGRLIKKYQQPKNENVTKFLNHHPAEAATIWTHTGT